MDEEEGLEEEEELEGEEEEEEEDMKVGLSADMLLTRVTVGLETFTAF